MTHPTRWHERWEEGRIGFHRDEVNPDLVAHERRWLGEQPHRILVPLCGKSVDLVWLAARGHEVVGVELVERGVRAFFEEQGLAPEISAEGPFTVFRSPGLTLYSGDVFELGPEQVGADRVRDRAALIALPPDTRERYVPHVLSLLAPNYEILLSAVEYDRAVMEGPPFSVSDADVRRYFADHEIETLSRVDDLKSESRWAERGHRYWFNSVYSIRAEIA